MRYRITCFEASVLPAPDSPEMMTDWFMPLVLPWEYSASGHFMYLWGGEGGKHFTEPCQQQCVETSYSKGSGYVRTVVLSRVAVSPELPSCVAFDV